MSKSLFTKKNRQEFNLKHNKETFFDFLERSCAPQANAARELLDRCAEQFSRANASRAEHLFKQCRQSDENFFAAGFELLLHSALIADEFEVEVAPTTEHNGHSPTFLVRAPKGNEFYLDCVSVPASTDQAIRELVLDTLKQMQHTRFMVSADFHGHSDGTIPDLALLQQKVTAWLDSLQPAGVEEHLFHNDLVSFGHKLSDGFFVELSALPRSVHDQQPASILCTSLNPLQAAHPITVSSPVQTQLRKVARSRAKKFRDSKKPYVMALSPTSPKQQISSSCMLDTVYGDLTEFRDHGGKKVRARKPNGLWSRHPLNDTCPVTGLWFFSHPLSAFDPDLTDSAFFVGHPEDTHHACLCNALGDYEYHCRDLHPAGQRNQGSRKKLARKLK